MTKSIIAILGIPLFAFFAAAATLNLGALITAYPDFDHTLYLAARSLSGDHDLVFSKEDSDRYFRENLRRPAGFLLTAKTVMSSDGNYKKTPVFYSPELFVFILTPFVGMFHFHGWLLLHAMLIACLYLIGYYFYRHKDDDSALPALNSVSYYTLIPVPLLFLLPTHHLFLFTAISASIYFGLTQRPILSAFCLSLAISSQPAALVIAGFLAACWRYRGTLSLTARFGIALLFFGSAALGIEILMYHGATDVRRITTELAAVNAEVWNSLPQVATSTFRSPDFQALADFVFGRSYGFAIYGTAALCLLLAAVWHAADPIARSALAMTILVLAVFPFINWPVTGSYAFINDYWLILCAAPYFAVPLARPALMFVLVVVFSSFTVGPLLANPLGAFTSRDYYVASFPYRYFPQELSTIGKSGVTGRSAYRMSFPGGEVYFLNSAFHQEPGFFWVHGESTLEWIIAQDNPRNISHLQIRNGAMENRITLNFGGHEEFIALGPSEIASIKLDKFQSSRREYKGRFFLHGTIKSSSGYVPKLLSRENPDYRYLGCQVQLISNNTQLGESLNRP